MIFEFDFNDLGNLLNTNKFLEIHSGTGSFSSTGRVAASDIINVSNDGTNNFVYFNKNKSSKIDIKKVNGYIFVVRSVFFLRMLPRTPSSAMSEMTILKRHLRLDILK